MRPLVLATANPDKAAEMAAILEPLLGKVVRITRRPAELPDVVEDGDTLEANARLKAVAVSEATGELVVADDSGLEVDAFGGAPGVHSSRYAGEDATYADNVLKLLDALAELPEPGDRVARFRSVAIARFPDGDEVIAEGVVDGTIALGPRGRGGFGYDPVFVPDEGDGRTYAEMDADEKHAFSHRGRALRALVAELRRRL